MKRLLALLSLCVLFACLGALCWLVSTESGLQWTLQRVLPRLPPSIAISGLSGRLAGPLSAREFEYRDRQQVITARDIQLDWRPWRLLAAEFDLLELRVAALHVDLPTQAEATATGKEAAAPPSVALPIDIRLRDVEISAIDIVHGERHYRIDRVGAVANLDDNGLTVERLDVDSDMLELDLAGSLEPFADYRHDLLLNWKTALPSGATLLGHGEIIGDAALSRIAQSVGGALQVELDLKLRDWLTAPAWQAAIAVTTTDSLAVDHRLPPLAGKLEIDASGSLENAAINGKLDAESPEIGPMRADFRLSSPGKEHAFSGLDLDALEVVTRQGRISATGRLDWAPQLRWRADIAATGLNPETLLPQWPAEIDAQLSSEGAMRGDEIHASVEIVDLRGTLRQYPVSLQGRLDWENGAIDIPRLDFASGDSRLHVEGRVDDDLDLRWSLDSRDLGELYPRARGVLRASGDLAGTRESPGLESSFSGKGIGYSGYRVESLDGKLSLDLLQPERFELELNGESIDLQGRILQSLQVTANSQGLDATARASEASARLTLNGEFRDDRWIGKLQRADIRTRDYRDWKLARPAAIDLSRDSILLDRTCLQSNGGSEICNRVSGADETWNIDLDVKGLPLSQLDRLFASGLALDGAVDADASLEYRAAGQGRLLGSVTMASKRGSASYSLGQGESASFDYAATRVEVKILETGIEAAAALERDNGDRFDATVVLPGARPLELQLESQPVEARADLVARDLDIVDGLIGEITGLRGALHIGFDLSGTLAEPRVDGSAHLRRGAFTVSASQTRIGGIDFEAHSEGLESVDYHGRFDTAGGVIELRGDTRLNADAGWPSRLVLAGDSIDVESLFAPWLPPQLAIEGLLQTKARLDFSAPDSLTGEVELGIGSGRIDHPLLHGASDKTENGEPSIPGDGSFDFRSARLALQLRDDGISAKVGLERDNGDRVDASLLFPGAGIFDLDLESQRLVGDAAIEASGLAIVDAMLSEIDGLKGRFEMKVDLSGSIADPGIKGNVSLRDGELTIAASQTRLTGIEIDVRSRDADSIVYRGKAAIADGELTLQGETRLDAAAGWPSKVEVAGASLDIASLLGPRIPAEIEIDGSLQVDAGFEFSAPHNLQGEIRLSAPNGNISYPLLEGEVEDWEYRELLLSLVFDESGIRGESGFSIGRDNFMQGSFNLPRAKLLALDRETQAVTGSASLVFNEMSVVEALIPDIGNLRAALTLGLSVDGTLANPSLIVSAEMADASVDIQRLGLQIRQINFRGGTDSENIFRFRLDAVSGDGALSVSGESRLDAKLGWPTSFTIKGENYEAAKIPEASVILSPDLVVEIRDHSIDLRGDIFIPRARLQPRDITTAAQVSNDAVIVDSRVVPETRWQITSRINLILGDRVSFFGFGFEGRLGGSLLIEEEAGQLTRGTGEITIPEGRYRAYGQRLDVENGRLLFTGGPLTNPGLDLRAVRTTGQVTAGVQVSGLLRQPLLELFSNPSMGQTDTLSYLMFGRPMETASGEEGEMLAKATLALGLAGGDQFARSIGDRFGLDEMRIESSDTGDQASLVVGRYLSPKMYVSYGVGLIGSFNTFNLRYTITEQWQLKAEGGENHGADLMYTFER